MIDMVDSKGTDVGRSEAREGETVTRPIAITLTIMMLAGCQGLPADVEGFETRCLEMTTEPIPPHADDPHEGFKRVYACNVSDAQRRALQAGDVTVFPEEALIVKASRRDGEDFNWLVATARKLGGQWEWLEYTRNFDDERFLEIPASPQVCVDCHRAATASDWIFTRFAR